MPHRPSHAVQEPRPEPAHAREDGETEPAEGGQHGQHDEQWHQHDGKTQEEVPTRLSVHQRHPSAARHRCSF